MNDKNDKQEGGTRMIRRSIASTLYNDYRTGKASVEDIYKQISTMAHSTDTHIKDYIYNVK